MLTVTVIFEPSLFASSVFNSCGLKQLTSNAVAAAQMQSKAMDALIHGCQVALTCCPTLPGLQSTNVFTLGNKRCC